jgi:hypothetical protein
MFFWNAIRLLRPRRFFLMGSITVMHANIFSQNLTKVESALLVPERPDALGLFPARSERTAQTSACFGATTRASRRHQPTRGQHLHGRLRARRVGFPFQAQTVAVRWRERKQVEGEERASHATQGRSRSPTAGRCLLATGAIATCATPDLLLKHPNETFTTYV